MHELLTLETIAAGVDKKDLRVHAVHGDCGRRVQQREVMIWRRSPCDFKCAVTVIY